MDEQQSTIVDLQQQLQRMEHHVQQLLRDRYGPRSERVDPNQLPLFEHDDSEESKESTVDKNDRSLGSTTVCEHPRRGGGRNPLPEHLPRERIEHDLPEEQKACPCCGEQRARIGCEKSEQLEFVPASLKVIEHVRWKYACRRCEEHVQTAAVPAKPIPKGMPGPGLLSQLVVSKYSDHLPLYRLEDIFVRHGVELSRSTLCRWVMQTASLLEPLTAAVCLFVLSQDT